MKSVPIDDAFLQGAALLLVEDPLTAVALRECWSRDPTALEIMVRPVGGRESVLRLVQAAREQNKHTVFGFVDRDFGSVRTGPVVFSTDRHEIENELLDTAVIAALSGQPEAVIDAALEAESQRLVEWMGVRYLLRARFMAQARFPADPGIAEANQRWVEVEAESYNAALKQSAINETLSVWRNAWLASYRGEAESQRIDGAWRTEFSGKELFAALVAGVMGGRFRGAAEDRARAIAERWRKQPPLQTPPFPACIQRVRDRIVAECSL